MCAGIVLHASLRSPQLHAHWHQPLLASLPYAHRLRLGSRNEPGQRASLAGLALALIAAERVAGHSFSPRALVLPQEGKPSLRDGPGFSVSHSDSRVAVVAGAGPDCGIDIEDFDPGADALATGKLQRWTATEAALKAMGLGLRDVRDVVLDEGSAGAVVRGERIMLQRLTSLPGVVGHVASRSACTPVITEIDLDGAVFSAALQRSLGLASQFD